MYVCYVEQSVDQQARVVTHSVHFRKQTYLPMIKIQGLSMSTSGLSFRTFVIMEENYHMK